MSFHVRDNSPDALRRSLTRLLKAATDHQAALASLAECLIATGETSPSTRVSDALADALEAETQSWLRCRERVA